MNINQTKCVLNILNYLGIKWRLIKSLTTGQRHIGVVYNKFGDTVPFNPYTRLGDSMRIAMLMNIDVSFSEKEVRIRPSSNATNDTCMVLQLKDEAENRKIHRVGNQVVNCATAMIKRIDK